MKRLEQTSILIGGSRHFLVTWLKSDGLELITTDHFIKLGLIYYVSSFVS